MSCRHRRHRRRARPRLPDTGIPEPEAVPSHPSRIEELRIELATNAADRALWNTLIARGHPHGMTIFAGRQLRCLVGSSHGWPGAAGFSAAALRAAARDRWIGRDDDGRRDHLQRVLCLSRFLRRLPGDFEARYDCRPCLVESFADEGHDGTCLRAAGFLMAGTTTRRGRTRKTGHETGSEQHRWEMHDFPHGWRRVQACWRPGPDRRSVPSTA